MSDYECPSCGGGFPERALGSRDACPWCGEELDGDDGIDGSHPFVNPRPLGGFGGDIPDDTTPRPCRFGVNRTVDSVDREGGQR